MNHKDFENKLKKIQDDLTNYISENYTLEKDFFNNTFSFLNEKLKTKQQLLKAVEEKLIQDHNKNDSFILNLKNTVDDKFKDLENEIQLFSENHTIKSKKELLEHKKEEELNDFRIAKKREKNEIQNKINSLEKEKAVKIKEFDNLFIEEERKHKNKVSDLSRKLNFDIQKCSEDNIKEYSDLEKNLLNVNNPKEIKKIKSEITNIRKNGLLEQNKIKRNYFLNLHDEMLAYSKNKEHHIMELNALESEYNLRIEELKNRIKVLEFNEINAITLIDFKNEEKIIEYTRDISNKKLEMKNEYLNYRYNENNTAINSINALYNNKRNSYFSLVEDLNKFDRSQVDEYRPMFGFTNNYFNQKIRELTLSLNQIVNTYKDYIILLISDLIESKFSLTQKMYELLLIYNYNGFNEMDFSFNKVVNDLKILNEDFYKMQKLRFENFKKDLLVSFRLIIKQIDIMLTSINEYREQEITQESLLLESINNLLLRNNLDVITSYKRFVDTSKEEEVKNINLFVNDTNFQKESYTKETLNVKQEYEKSITELRSKENDYYAKAHLGDFQEIVNAINQDLSLNKKRYKDTLLKIETDLNKEYKTNVSLVDKEYKDKIKLL